MYLCVTVLASICPLPHTHTHAHTCVHTHRHAGVLHKGSPFCGLNIPSPWHRVRPTVGAQQMFVGFSKPACFTTHHQFRCPLTPWTQPALGLSQGSHPPAHVSQMSLLRVHPTPFLPLPALLGFPRALLGRVKYSKIWASQPLSTSLSLCTLAPLHTSAPTPSRVLSF